MPAGAGRRCRPTRTGSRPRVRSHCRFRNRGTEYVSDSGMKRMSGGTKRPCGRVLCRPRPARTGRPLEVAATGSWQGGLRRAPAPACCPRSRRAPGPTARCPAPAGSRRSPRPAPRCCSRPAPPASRRRRSGSSARSRAGRGRRCGRPSAVGFGRIVGSEIEVPNMFLNLV